jgi:toxin ParE1/3/4
MARRIVHARAKADVNAIADYIARDSLDASLRFYRAVEEAIERLAEMPGMGAIYESKNPRFATIRIWPITGFRNFLVCYLPFADGVEVLRMIHGAMDVNRVFK